MRTFDRGVEIETADDYELQRELEMTLEYLAEDLRVCGRGYPSPRYATVREIVAEQERRANRWPHMTEHDRATTWRTLLP